MEETKKSGFQFTGFHISKSFIENKGLSKVSSDDLEMEFLPRGEKNDNKNEYRLFIEVKISSEDKSFVVNIEAVGFFNYPGNIDNTILSNYFYINAPAILFPYLRAYISALTTLSGFDTVTLPTINFTYLGNRLKENTKEISAQGI